MADEQPRPREDLVQLLLVEIRIDEDFTADETLIGVDELGDIIEAAADSHGRSPSLAHALLETTGRFGSRRRRSSLFADVHCMDIILEFSIFAVVLSRRRSL